VAHWAKAVGPEVGIATWLARSADSAREKALAVLISANWLKGEAVARGLRVSKSTVEHGLAERIDSVPNGRSEFEKELAATGRTVADAELEIEVERASAALRAMVLGEVPQVTHGDVVNYYEQHRAQFYVPELRVVDLRENSPTRSAAIALGRRLGPGERFMRGALREDVAKQTSYEAAHRENGALVHTIMTTQVGSVSDPVKFKRAWVLAVVRKVIPARFKPIAAVAAEVGAHLSAERRRLAMSNFIRAFRSRWTVKTDCRPGYVVQKCAQYRGPIAPESNPLTGGA
jgi:parvulin-like peptidyl-prolyl cis-trans isomerase-like protein